jgi:putative transposase
MFRVRVMCAVLGVSASGFYGWARRPVSLWNHENRRLLTRIQSIHADSEENYGAIKTWKALRAEGETCGRHRVARIRRINGIVAKRMRRFRAAYAARNSAPAAPNLLAQNFTADAPNRIWVGDITFIPTRKGWLYLAVQVDLFSRRIIGWSMSNRINQQLTIDALIMAIQQRNPPPGLIHHSDQGIQYSGTNYKTILKTNDMIASMSRKGNCYDNAVAESFFSNLKNELVYHCDYHDRDEARAAIFKYIEVFYNRKRLHETLDYVSPAQYEVLTKAA